MANMILRVLYMPVCRFCKIFKIYIFTPLRLCMCHASFLIMCNVIYFIKPSK